MGRYLIPGGELDKRAIFPIRYSVPGLGARTRHNWGRMGLEYIWIIFFCGLATAIIGKAKGSSFFLWFLIGAVLPILGLIAVILSRREKDEPERQCPQCLKAVKLYVQVCPRCGTELYLPDPRAVRHPGVRG
jgi:uncharacterized paraquat-inducible protein A